MISRILFFSATCVSATLTATDALTITSYQTEYIHKTTFPCLHYPFRPQCSGFRQLYGEISKHETLFFYNKGLSEAGTVSPERKTTLIKKRGALNNLLFRLAHIKGRLFYISVNEDRFFEILPTGELTPCLVGPRKDAYFFNTLKPFKYINELMLQCVKRLTDDKECILYIGSNAYEITRNARRLYASLITKRGGQVAPEPTHLAYLCLTSWHILQHNKSIEDMFAKPSRCTIS